MKRTALLLMILAAAWPALAAAPPGDQDFREGWRIYARLLQTSPRPPLEERSQIIESAIAKMESAAAAQKRPEYLESAAYLRFQNFQHKQAEANLTAAIPRDRRNPLARYLLAQVKGGLVAVNPETIATKWKPVVTEYQRTLGLDRGNAMIPLQAASTLFDLGLPNEADKLVDQALSLPEFRVYQLPVSQDLYPDPKESASAWQAVQDPFWANMFARAMNAARKCIQIGRGMEELGQPDQAASYYQKAVNIGVLMAGCQPALLTGMGAAISAQGMGEDSLERLFIRLGRQDQASRAKASLERIRAAREALARELTSNSVPLNLEHEQEASARVRAALEGK